MWQCRSFVTAFVELLGGVLKVLHNRTVKSINLACVRWYNRGTIAINMPISSMLNTSDNLATLQSNRIFIFMRILQCCGGNIRIFIDGLLQVSCSFHFEFGAAS